MIINVSFDIGDKCTGNDCNYDWWLNPPAEIHNEPGKVRCIGCKRVFEFQCVEMKE